jgi:hypothetical protein
MGNRETVSQTGRSTLISGHASLAQEKVKVAALVGLQNVIFEESGVAARGD